MTHGRRKMDGGGERDRIRRCRRERKERKREERMMRELIRRMNMEEEGNTVRRSIGRRRKLRRRRRVAI